MKRSTLTLAITLAFSFTAAPADALLTEGQKCAMKANLLSGKFSLCLSKADANVSKGRLSDTAAADAKCETKFRDGWDKTRTKAQEKDADNGNAEMLGADCNGAMSDAVRDSVEASALIAAGRHDMRAFAVSEADLADDSGVQGLIDEAVAAVDITSDNAALCTDAGGTYDAGTDTCTPGYNCTLGAMCSTWAAEYPENLPNYTNNYVGHTAATFGCSEARWEDVVGYVTIWELNTPNYLVPTFCW